MRERARTNALVDGIRRVGDSDAGCIERETLSSNSSDTESGHDEGVIKMDGEGDLESSSVPRFAAREVTS